MSNYDGLFVRSKLDQSNSIPRSGALSSSPDIIPQGLMPVSNPQESFGTDASYNQDLGKTLEAGKTNYVYLRGKNYSNQRIEDKGETKPRLFWSKASLLTFPSKWKELKENPTGEPFSLVADPGKIGVINQPFIWQPENIDNDHYCMIAQLPSPGQDNKIPDVLEIGDFAGWVARNGGIAWRNVVVNNAKTLVLTDMKMFYEQGDVASQMQFTIICTNVPKGSKISFSSGAPGPNPPIYLEPTIVSTFPSFITGVSCNVPANYASNVYFSIEAPPGVTSFVGVDVDIQAAFPTTQGTKLFSLGHAPSELGYLTMDEGYARIKRELEKSGESSKLLPEHDQYLEQLSSMNALHAGPKRLIVVGAMKYKWV